MGQMANILVKDDSNPLVEYTFYPVTNDPPTWRTQIPGIPMDGQMSLIQLANNRLPTGDYRRVLKLEVPVMETVGASGTSAGYVAPQKVAYVVPYTVTTVQPSRAAIADMANACKIMLAILAGASAVTATGTLNGASVADAVKNSTAMAPRFQVYGENAY